MPSKLASDLLDALDQLSGGVHPGFRPVHARGVMYSGSSWISGPSPSPSVWTSWPRSVARSSSTQSLGWTESNRRATR
jgi:catalase